MPSFVPINKIYIQDQFLDSMNAFFKIKRIYRKRARIEFTFQRVKTMEHEERMNFFFILYIIRLLS